MTEAQNVVRGWFEGLGREIGFDFVMDEMGVCTFESGGLPVVTLVSEEQRELFLYASVGVISASDSAAFYRRLMVLSVPDGELNGAAFSIHDPSETIVLGYTRNLDVLDFQGFKNLLGGFAELARTWVPKIETLKMETAQPEPVQAPVTVEGLMPAFENHQTLGIYSYA